jgi:hypothetical protein
MGGIVTMWPPRGTWPVGQKLKCVDDTILWDGSLEKHWWRVIHYLDLVGNNGIILNPNKFQFCGKEVEFAGFLLTESAVKPLPKYINSIQNFPRPTNITDIRAWFGLVNQVSHYGQLGDLMAPFRPFLSPKVRFYWNDNLEETFQQLKQDVITSIEEGVEIFDPARKTCLSMDWSKKGNGYFLYQQHCSYILDTTLCCQHGWRITLAGLRFLKKGEENYWPVEGEFLAATWALDDTKFFTWGCDNLVLQTDHQPLVVVVVASCNPKGRRATRNAGSGRGLRGWTGKENVQSCQTTEKGKVARNEAHCTGFVHKSNRLREVG